MAGQGVGRYVEVTPEDIRIEVRFSNLQRVGQIAMQYMTDAKFIKRFNNVGSWELTLDENYFLTNFLTLPAAGIIVTLYDKVYMSGPMTSYVRKRSTDDPVGTVTFTGQDDNCHLGDYLAWPDVNNVLSNAQKQSDDRENDAESLMLLYVLDNMAPISQNTFERALPGGLEADRWQNLMGTGGPDNPTTTAPTMKWSAKFDNLGKMITDIAVQGGGLGFELQQGVSTNTATAGQDRYRFRVYKPRDQSKLIRMDVDNDLLSEVESGLGVPTLTRAIVSGKAVMPAGDTTPIDQVPFVYVEVTDAEAQEAEVGWQRRIEQYIDDGNENDVTKLNADGQQAITEGGRTIVNVKATPSDNETMRFGIDWFLGDVVSVVVDTFEMYSVVSESILQIDPDGVKIGATIGDPTGFDYDAQVAAKISNHEQRLQDLERK